MAKIYACISTKGGVGKTTLSVNLAAILAGMDQRHDYRGSVPHCELAY